jgi:hypothetical protein
MSNMCATVRMEEKYLKININYTNLDEKNAIFNTVSKLDEKYKLHPDVYIRVLSENSGHYTIEFSNEHDNRETGTFFEELLKSLDIKECQ